MSDPAATVVLLNWNSGGFGRLAVQSVVAQSVRCELIVVDNASDDDSLDQILAAVEPDMVIRHRTNLGFTGGMNAGIARATTPFVLPLNCDVVLDSRYVETALAVMDRHPEAAVVGGAVGWVDALPSPVPDAIDQPDEGPMDLTITMRTLRRPPVRGRCSKASGACPVSRVAALAAVSLGTGEGPYDPVFDTYGEDIDLAIKLHRAGWQVRYEPDMRAIHARSFSSARRLADKRGRLRRNVIRGRWISIIRHVPTRQLPLAVTAALAEDVGFALRQIVRRDWSVVTDTAAAWHFVAARLSSEIGYRRAHRSTLGLGPTLAVPGLAKMVGQARRS